MAEQPKREQKEGGAPAAQGGAPTGEGKGRGFGRGGQKREGGPQRGGPRPRRGGEEPWVPLTKLGRLVKSGKIKSIDDIFRFSVPIKEYQIVDHFLKDKLKEEPLSIFPVQKQTTAGQRTRFKAYVVIGDSESHIGLGWKSAKEVQGAIKGAVIHAKLNLVPVRQGYWGNKIGRPHTVPCKVTGKGGSVRVRLIPAPRGTGIVAAATSKKVLQLAGIQDCYSSSQGKTRTRSNFLKATYNALEQTYKFQNPDFWGQKSADPTPFETNNKFLKDGKE